MHVYLLVYESYCMHKAEPVQHLNGYSKYVHTSLPLLFSQFTAALEYLKANPVDPIDTQDFEHHCGVGVVTSMEEITAEVLKNCFH